MNKTTVKNAPKPFRRTGLKQPPGELARWIRLANLVPVDTFLGDIVSGDWDAETAGKNTWAEVLERILTLPPAVQEELISRTRPDSPPLGDWLGMPRDVVKIARVDERYNEIRTAYTHLRMLSQGETKSIDPLESLVSELRYAELPYLRQCGHPPCRKIFYATKSVQPGCTPAHSSLIRKRRKRDRDNLNAQYNRYIKKRRAETARKR